MAVTNQYGAIAPVAQSGANNSVAPHGYVHAPYNVLYQDRVQVAAGASIGSTVQMADLDWEAVLDPDASKLHFDAAGAAVTVSIGCASDPDALVSAQSLNAAGSVSLMAAVDRSAYGNKVWQLMGFSTLDAARATGSRCRVILTTAAFAVVNATDLFWVFKGTNT